MAFGVTTTVVSASATAGDGIAVAGLGAGMAPTASRVSLAVGACDAGAVPLAGARALDVSDGTG